MPRPRQHEPPTYEDWVRTTATDLENRADVVIGGVPCVAVTISASSARWIATILRNHAQDIETNRG